MDSPVNRISRHTYSLIEDWIEPGSRVLDLGCGDGALLDRLIERKKVEGIGVEISQSMIVRCLGRGISVYQADIDRGLSQWDDMTFDYVILNDTIQVISRPHEVMNEMLRVGRYAIISVSNFGYIGNRIRIFLEGRMNTAIRTTGAWHDTPVIRFVSLSEFKTSLREINITLVDAWYYVAHSSIHSRRSFLSNLLADQGLFKLKREE